MHQASLANLVSRIDLNRAVIKQAIAVLQGSEADATRAARDFARVQELKQGGWASQSTKDQTEAEHLRARAKIAEGRATLAAARQQMQVLETQRPQVEADIAAALATLQLAKIELESTVIRSPVDGWVAERQAKIGQYVRQGTLLVAVVSRDVWLVANFKETQISELHPGDSMEIAIDAVPEAVFKGRVDSISPASGAQFALLPPDNATGNFTRILQRIPVKIVFDFGQVELGRLRPGMSAVATLSSGGVAEEDGQ
jgi:membrane fusion protein (multidrug efflux system)